jgi:hypothetical protein
VQHYRGYSFSVFWVGIMSTGYVVFLGVILLIVIYVYVYRKKFGIEGFISYTVDDPSAKAACAPKTLVQDPVKPDVAQLGVGSIPPSKAVGEIPYSTYAPRRAASMPYRNPGTEPSRYINILSALQQFQAFFGFEAPALESECSPTVVLPLQTARADMSRLQTQSDVLERNPGIPSTITTKELAQMMSNLRYLQKEARKYKANSGTELLGGNSYSGKVVEGFRAEGFASQTKTTGKIKIIKKSKDEGFTNGAEESDVPAGDSEFTEIFFDEESGIFFDLQGNIYDPVEVLSMYGIENVFNENEEPIVLDTELINELGLTQEQLQELGIDGETEDSELAPACTPATLTKLTSFRIALDSVITNLKKGTANSDDTITLARISTFERLRNDIDAIIVDLSDGNITQDQVPVCYEDIEKATNELSDIDKSIGTVIRNVSLPPALATLFPSDMNYKDKISISELGEDILSYMDELVDGLSWKAKGDISMEVKYDSQRALDIANANATKGSVKGASAEAVDNTDYASASASASAPEATNTYNATSTSYIYGRPSGASTEAYADRPTGLNADGTRIILQDPVAGGFDWKGRAEHVCGQIKSLGMEPTAFGCVKAADVGSNYSWRGNVAMVCSRLKSTTDPGLPVSAGCPPASWDGWKS